MATMTQQTTPAVSSRSDSPDIPEFGLPTPWLVLARPASMASIKQTNALLSIPAESQQEILTRVVEQGIAHVAEFLATCPELTFFFVGWDHLRHTVVMRCGPTKQQVVSMLRWRGSRRRRHRNVDEDMCERVYESVEIIQDELDRREKISYVLMSWLDDEPMPEIRASLDHTHTDAWNSIRLTLPIEFAETLPETPPPSSIDLERTTIQPAPPTVWEPDPAICPISWSEYQRNNPMRSLDWRWSRSWALVRHSRYFCRKRDDEVTGRAVRFLRQLLNTPQDTASIKRKYPDLAAAHSIRTGPEDTRIELEARILARQSPEEIAKSLSVSPSSVRTYVAIFFDVLDRLKARMFIQKQVIQPAWRFRAAEGLLMSLAYHGGPTVLHAAIPLLRQNGRELQRLTAGNKIQSALATRLDLVLQARLLPDDEKTRKDLIRRYLDLLDTFPQFEPKLDLIGSYSQIVGAFEGELHPVSSSEPEMEVAVDRAA